MPTTLLRKSSALSTHAAADTRVPAPLTRKASGRVLGQASQPTIASPTDALLSPVSRAIKRRVRKVPIVREKVGPTLPALHLPIVLGSSSAVRAAVLERHGVTFTVAAADIDEKAIRHADAKTMTVLIARAKAQALQGRLTSPCILVTADQIVLAPDGSVREKPLNKVQAAKFIESYSGATARTVSAVVVTNTQTGAVADGVDVATVHFDDTLNKPGELERALQAAVPVDPLTLPASVRGAAAVKAASTAGHTIDLFNSAGALVIEHPVLASHIRRIEGSIDSVQGLPWALTVSLIQRVTSDSANAAAVHAAAASVQATSPAFLSRRRTRSSFGGEAVVVLDADSGALDDAPLHSDKKRKRRESVVSTGDIGRSGSAGTKA